MTDRPILFSAPMIRAIMEGRKTQTRRVAKITDPMGKKIPVGPLDNLIELGDGDFRSGEFHYGSAGWLSGPYPVPFAVGDRLWARETWAIVGSQDPGLTVYRADYPHCVPGQYENVPEEREIRWSPSIHMPRRASRLTLLVTDVRVQRLQDITEEDAMAEGVRPLYGQEDLRWYSGVRNPDGTINPKATARDAFRDLWDLINGPGAWDANPWVTAVTFDVKHDNIDAMGGGGMMILSDRRRIELAIYPRLFARWMLAASEGKDSDIENLRNLRLASSDPLAGTGVTELTLRRRLKRLEWTLTAPLEDRPLSLVFLSFVYALRDELAEGVLVLHAGSSFDLAYEAIKEAVLEHEADPEVINDDLRAEAEGIAAWIRRTCRANGYFREMNR